MKKFKYEDLFFNEGEGTYKKDVWHPVEKKRYAKPEGFKFPRHDCKWCGKTLDDQGAEYHPKCLKIKKSILDK